MTPYNNLGTFALGSWYVVGTFDGVTVWRRYALIRNPYWGTTHWANHLANWPNHGPEAMYEFVMVYQLSPSNYSPSVLHFMGNGDDWYDGNFYHFQDYAMTSASAVGL